MRKGSKRLAQVWAVTYMQGVERVIASRREQFFQEKGEEIPLEILFPCAVPLDPVEKGKAIRIVQEVNLAKKQETARRQEENLPPLENWVLKLYQPTDDEPLQCLHLYYFQADTPTGRTANKGYMFEKAMEFMYRLDEEEKKNAPTPPSTDSLLDQYMKGD